MLAVLPTLHLPHRPPFNLQLPPRCAPPLPQYVLLNNNFYDAASKWVQGWSAGHITSADHPLEAGVLPSPSPSAPPVPFSAYVVDEHTALKRVTKLGFVRELRTRFITALVRVAPHVAYSTQYFGLDDTDPDSALGTQFLNSPMPLLPVQQLLVCPSVLPDWGGIILAACKPPHAASSADGAMNSPNASQLQHTHLHKGAPAAAAAGQGHEQHAESSARPLAHAHTSVNPRAPEANCVLHPDGTGPLGKLHTNGACKDQKAAHKQLTVKQQPLKQSSKPRRVDPFKFMHGAHYMAAREGQANRAHKKQQRKQEEKQEKPQKQQQPSSSSEGGGADT